MNSSVAIRIMAIAVCLLFSAIASAAETSLTGVRRSRLQHLAEEGSRPAAIVLALVRSPQRFLITILVINSVAIVAASSLATSVTDDLLVNQPTWIHNLVSVTAMSIIVLILAEITPKSIAIEHLETYALRLGPVVALIGTVLRPITWFLTVTTLSIARLLGGSGATLDQLYTEEELLLLVDTSEEQGFLKQEESAMIHGIFDFGDTVVREVMRPRIDVLALEVNTPIEEATRVAVEGGHTRIPVYDGTIDNVVGVLYVKDLLRLLHMGQPYRTLRDLMRPAYFVPATQRIDQVFHEMRARRVHLAIVLDEYGGVAGIVTIEDLLEEIVGDIQDEYDKESPEVQQIDDDTFEVDGGVTIGTINDLLGSHLPSSDFDTVAGLVYSQTGANPKEGDVARLDDLVFTVLAVEGRRVRRVRVEKLLEAHPDQGESQSD